MRTRRGTCGNLDHGPLSSHPLCFAHGTEAMGAMAGTAALVGVTRHLGMDKAGIDANSGTADGREFGCTVAPELMEKPWMTEQEARARYTQTRVLEDF